MGFYCNIICLIEDELLGPFSSGMYNSMMLSLCISTVGACGSLIPTVVVLGPIVDGDAEKKNFGMSPKILINGLEMKQLSIVMKCYGTSSLSENVSWVMRMEGM
eukprot:TRINITY_DN27763_c0_g1_i1.p1 TRINITY_DN27763_c0_g1~~TRINITY_DN27763_c0_g1_i1.p1  ORF type:complete len:104 (-),score=11.43 TRINITY_DN27763_c0_g1_i1:77-388(-)